MKALWFFVAIGVVVAGAFWYLNRNNCPNCTNEERAAKQNKYCAELQAKIDSGEGGVSYGERVGALVNRCN